MKNMECCTRY